MKFLIVSGFTEGTSIASKLKSEGHDVFYASQKNPKTLSGIVETTSIENGLKRGPDVVVFASNGNGKLADKLKEDGWPVIGGGVWNDKLAYDAKFAMKAMESFGIKAPNTYTFSNVKDAIEFVASHKDSLVLNPYGCDTYVSKGRDDMLAHMAYLKKHDRLEAPIHLQEFVFGSEVCTEVWYSKGKPVAMPTSSLETSRFLSNDLGPWTDCQTSAVFAYPKRQPKMIQQSLKKINIFLERIRYSGPMSIKAIVNGGKFFGLEFLPSFRPVTISAWISILDEPLAEVLNRCANGDDSQIKFKEGFGFAQRVTMSPYPYSGKDVSGREIMGLENNYFPVDMYVEKGKLYTGGSGVICDTFGFSTDIYEADKIASYEFKKIKLDEKQARLDGGRSAQRRLDDLRWQGYEVPPFIKPEAFFGKGQINEKTTIVSITSDSVIASAI